jgi:hypothetical protein
MKKVSRGTRSKFRNAELHGGLRGFGGVREVLKEVNEEVEAMRGARPAGVTMKYDNQIRGDDCQTSYHEICIQKYNEDVVTLAECHEDSSLSHFLQRRKSRLQHRLRATV